MARLLIAALWAWGLGAQATPSAPPLADPMAPPPQARLATASKPPDDAGLPLLAIQRRGHRPQALIGTRWVGVGERAERATVLSIDELGIRLKVDGQTVWVPLGQAIPSESSSSLP